MDVTLLDRGDAPDLPGVERIPFAAWVYGMEPPTAADSIAMEALCRHLKADAFLSTYYSTPLSTPAVQMVYDMIPEVLGLDMRARIWPEKEAALLYARAHVCISDNTRTDLLRLYPEIDAEAVTVAHCGVEHDVFRPRPPAEVAAFREAQGIDGPYLMMVGSRIQANGYKNGPHLFEALEGMEARPDLTLLCVGGEAELPEVAMGGTPIAVRRARLSDDDLARAYSGAEALVYPSLYEGFGMPPVEAMACGCPVITTDHGSLREVVGDAALLVSGHDLTAMRAALREVREPGTRARLAKAGPERAERFRWDTMADHLGDRVEALVAESRTGRHDVFLRDWAVLRRLQADVDIK
jgi:glycosyltransferase involved in cell wall biosynthesis